MQSLWRSNTPLRSHADWREHIDPKNRRAGTSAPTLAAVWSGPVELHGALARHSAFDGMTTDRIVVEAQSTFDAHPGGKRNHDLVLHGRVPSGDRVVVCVEAKAGEALGQTVAEYRAAAERKQARGEATNALRRLDGLLARYVPSYPDDDRVGRLRYQLLTALAGTEAEAAAADARHAVLMLHELLTDQRPGDGGRELELDLHGFFTAVFDCEPPALQHAPWCCEVTPPSGTTAHTLYVARALTDLRAVAVEG